MGTRLDIHRVSVAGAGLFAGGRKPARRIRAAGGRFRHHAAVGAVQRVAGTAGAATGEYLICNLNGNVRKIQLLAA